MNFKLELDLNSNSRLDLVLNIIIILCSSSEGGYVQKYSNIDQDTKFIVLISLDDETCHPLSTVYRTCSLNLGPE